MQQSFQVGIGAVWSTFFLIDQMGPATEVFIVDKDTLIVVLIVDFFEGFELFLLAFLQHVVQHEGG